MGESVNGFLNHPEYAPVKASQNKRGKEGVWGAQAAGIEE
jgi:hypothetical protein